MPVARENRTTGAFKSRYKLYHSEYKYYGIIILLTRY